MNDYQEAIENARRLLSENTEWIKRFDGYADAIIANEEFLRSRRKLFNEWTPLRFYISVSKAKRQTTLTLDVRYMGQNIAELKVGKDDMVRISTKGFGDKNKRDFCCDITLNEEAKWEGIEARRFRSYFKRNMRPRSTVGNKGNEEHNVESLLITEFLKAGKLLRGIRPVRIAGIRFGMPTPLSASDHKKLEYSGPNGGGVDILARTGRGRHGIYLTVIEVKDENKPDEPPQAALKQAIEYAVFLRELLRSESGAKWWRLFGRGEPLPKKLTIRCACAMPDHNPDKSFEKNRYNVDDENYPADEIECHYIYFKMVDGKIEKIDSSLDDTTKSPESP